MATGDLESDGGLRIGWATADLTPDRTVMIAGQFFARVSEGVRDPISATAMAVEAQSASGSPVQFVMAACDVVTVPDELVHAVQERLAILAPQIDPRSVILNATHTHCAPDLRGLGATGISSECGVDLGDVMSADEYVSWAADRIAGAIATAWERREPAGVGVGLSHATIGYNRRVCDYNGRTQMYGRVERPEFSHLEAGQDTSVNVMGVWNRQRQLTGVIVNVACPSQVSESEFQISADFWHETRQALRSQLGEGLFVLPQVSAAGDLAPARPTTVPDYKALARTWELRGLDQRSHIAQQIMRAVQDALQTASLRIDFDPPAAHRVETLSLSRRRLTEQDAQEALAEAAKLEREYQSLLKQLDADPDARKQKRWYVGVTAAYRRMNWNRQVAERFEQQARQPTLDTVCHVVRLGEGAFATNRFELYMDFGLQIKARSKAAQTFVVQLAGPGGYLPTQRAVMGGSYGAVPASTLVGPEGGRELVEWTVNAINTMFAENDVAAR